MTPTPPVPEIAAKLQAVVMDRYQGRCLLDRDSPCDERDGVRHLHYDPLEPADWCENCTVRWLLSALTTERLARQQAETDAIGSRDELNILKVKHAAEVLARQQAERKLAERERGL